MTEDQAVQEMTLTAGPSSAPSLAYAPEPRLITSQEHLPPQNQEPPVPAVPMELDQSGPLSSTWATVSSAAFTYQRIERLPEAEDQAP